jgi:hypothetical protein
MICSQPETPEGPVGSGHLVGQCSLWTDNVPRNRRFILAAVCHRVVDDVDGSVALLLTALDDTRSIRNARATQTKRADNEHGENDLGA